MKTLKYFMLPLLAFAVLFTACEEPDPEVYTGDDNFHFLTENSSADEASPLPVAIPVIFTKKTPYAGSVTFDITSSNATQNVDYVVLNTSNTLDYSDGEYADTIYIQPIDNATLDGDKVLNISLSNSGGVRIGWPGDSALYSTHTFTILDDDCATPLEGTFTEVTGGGAGDGAGGIGTPVDPFPWGAVLTVVKATCDGDGKYTVNDITMGLYPDGYGSSVNPGTFIVNGTSITIIEAESPDIVYGGDAFFGDGVVISDDQFTLNWSNSWGDQGSSTLTRQ